MSVQRSATTVSETRTWLMALATLYAVGLFVPVILPLAENRTRESFGLYFCYLLGILALTSALHRWPRKRCGVLLADATGLHLDGRLILPRRAISAVEVEQGRGIFTLLLRRRLARTTRVALHSGEEVDELLAAMRLERGRFVARYLLFRGSVRGSLIRVAVVPLLAYAVPPLLSLFFEPSVFLLAPCWLASGIAGSLYSVAQAARVSVGPDGILIRGWLGRGQFLPIAELRPPVSDRRSIQLHTVGGATIRLCDWVLRRSAVSNNVRGVADAINGALSARDARPSDGGDLASVLSRSGRGARQWLSDLRTSHESRASFRSRALPTETLWDVVANQTAAPGLRAAAAVALAGFPGERIRIRQLAADCSAPHLRVLLEAVASGVDDDEIARRLDEFR